jgi:hypothetical protein
MRFWRCYSHGLYICSAAMFMRLDNLYMYVLFLVDDVTSISRIYLYIRAFYRLLEVGCYSGQVFLGVYIGFEAGVCLVLTSISQPHCSRPSWFRFFRLFWWGGVPYICGIIIVFCHVPSVNFCASYTYSTRIIFAISKKINLRR